MFCLLVGIYQSHPRHVEGAYILREALLDQLVVADDILDPSFVEGVADPG